MYHLGFLLSSQAIRRQLVAMPCETYLTRLIHHCTQKPLSGQRLLAFSCGVGAISHQKSAGRYRWPPRERSEHPGHQ
jgi:hypothetical protein